MSSRGNKRFEPRTEEDREIERGQSALAHNYRMNELDRNVLGICCVRAAPKSQQPPAAQKPFRHFTAGIHEAMRFAREKGFE